MLLSEKLLMKSWRPTITELCWNQSGTVYTSGTPRVLYAGSKKVLYSTSGGYDVVVNYTNPTTPSVTYDSHNIKTFSSPDSSSSGMVYYGVERTNNSTGTYTFYTKTITPSTDTISETSQTIAGIQSGNTWSGANAALINNVPVFIGRKGAVSTNPGYVLYANTTALLDYSTGAFKLGNLKKLANNLYVYGRSQNGVATVVTYFKGTSTSADPSTANRVARVDLVYNGAYYALWDNCYGLYKRDTSFNQVWSIEIKNKANESQYIKFLGAYNGYLYAVGIPASSDSTVQVCTLYMIDPSDGSIKHEYDFADSFKNYLSYTWTNSCSGMRAITNEPIISYNGYFALIVTISSPIDMFVIKVP